MHIREAKPADAGGMARVQVDSYRAAYGGILPEAYLAHFSYEEQEADWRQLLTSRSDPVLYVAEQESGEVVGYALGDPSPDEVLTHNGLTYESELVALHVSPAFQRRGLGGELFSAVSSSLVEFGCGSLFLWVLRDNLARGFYEKHGGVLIAERAWVNNNYFGTAIYEVAYGF